MPLAFQPIACLIEFHEGQTSFFTVDLIWSIKFSSGVYNPLLVFTSSFSLFYSSLTL